MGAKCCRSEEALLLQDITVESSEETKRETSAERAFLVEAETVDEELDEERNNEELDEERNNEELDEEQDERDEEEAPGEEAQGEKDEDKTGKVEGKRRQKWQLIRVAFKEKNSAYFTEGSKGFSNRGVEEPFVPPEIGRVSMPVNATRSR